MNAPLISHHELSIIHQKVLARKTRQAIATTFAPGQHVSYQRGQGVELNDTRPYHHGDDIRHMDWRATARSGKATMKVFRDERQRDLYLIVDKTTTMNFGTRTTLKANIAARAAAILTLSAVTQHEPAAGLIISKKATYCPPGRSLDKAFELIQAIASPLEEESPSLWLIENIGKLLTQVRRQTRPGATLVLISDFIGFGQQHQALIAQLAHQRQLLAIQVSDPAEASIPNIGTVPLYSPITHKQHLVDTSDPEVRLAFERAMQQRYKFLRHCLASCDAPLYSLNTQHDVFSQLEPIW